MAAGAGRPRTKGEGKRIILAAFVQETGRKPSWKAARKWAKRAAQADRRAPLAPGAIVQAFNEAPEDWAA